MAWDVCPINFMKTLSNSVRVRCVFAGILQNLPNESISLYMLPVSVLICGL